MQVSGSSDALTGGVRVRVVAQFVPQESDPASNRFFFAYHVRISNEGEQAVRLLTSRSAEVFGIRDRGRLELGLAADLAIFDFERVGCSKLRRVNDLPGGGNRLIADATGMRAVVVNGRVIREHDEDVIDPEGPMPGRVLRRGVASEAN